jgi:UDP-N-acetylmuramate dehydrogenase
MTPLTKSQVDAAISRFPDVRLNEPMNKHTTFRLGGPARLYVVAVSSDDIVRAIETAAELNIPWSVIGGGTNLLVSDEGFEGLVIQVAHQAISIEGERVRVESGLVSALVARKTVEAGLTGFEWAVGLPGTIGGAIYGDAGCYGAEMRDSIASVDVYHIATKTRKQLTNQECQFGYRDSLFKHDKHVILGCDLQLKSAEDPMISRAIMEKILNERKDKQPLGESSAGCVFKNVDYQNESALDILRRDVDVPEEMLKSKRLPAGWLIDQAGLKGMAVGDFRVSEKHGNFLLNKGKGKASDVLALISLVKMKVRDTFGIELQEEVQLLGF